MRTGEKAGWAVIMFLAVGGLAAAAHRAVSVHLGLVDTTFPGLSDTIDSRYNQSPNLTYIHVLGGLVFMIIGPLQFSTRLRARHLSLHRWLGRAFLVIGMTMALAALILAAQPITFLGPDAITASYFFGVIFFVSAAKAYYHIRRKEILLHREWMIRAVAVGLGVSTVRLVITPLFFLTKLSTQDLFGVAFWIGWGLTMIAAEIWINVSRGQSAFVK